MWIQRIMISGSPLLGPYRRRVEDQPLVEAVLRDEECKIVCRQYHGRPAEISVLRLMARGGRGVVGLLWVPSVLFLDCLSAHAQ